MSLNQAQQCGLALQIVAAPHRDPTQPPKGAVPQQSRKLRPEPTCVHMAWSSSSLRPACLDGLLRSATRTSTTPSSSPSLRVLRAHGAAPGAALGRRMSRDGLGECMVETHARLNKKALAA